MNKNINNKLFISNIKHNKSKIVWIIAMLFIFILFFLLSLFFNGIGFVTDFNSLLEYDTLLRTLSAMITGFGLSIAGCGMQGVTRNDLTGPTTMGILPAASFGVIISQALKLNEVHFIFLFAFLFSFLILSVNFLLVNRNNSPKNYKPILVGLIIGAFLVSASFILKTIYPYISEKLTLWIGSSSPSGYTWPRFYFSCPAILIGSIMIISTQNKLNVIDKNVNLAISMGIKIPNVYWIIGIGTILISVSSIVLFGSVATLGIIIPHLTRIILKTRNFKWVLPISGLLSSSVLLFATFMNKLFGLTINLFTIVIFLPFFIFSFARKKEG